MIYHKTTCIKCNGEVPEQRFKLGYRFCIKCSNVQSYGCVDIVNHKTGNTVQPVHRETADAINKASRRSGFGVMRGMLAGQSQKQKLPAGVLCKVPPCINPSEEVFNQVGEKLMCLLEESGYDAACAFIYKNVKDSRISISQSYRLFDILNSLVY